MAERDDAQFSQIPVVEMMDERKIDMVLGKRSRVLPESQLLQPRLDLHVRLPNDLPEYQNRPAGCSARVTPTPRDPSLAWDLLVGGFVRREDAGPRTFHR